MFLLSGDSMYFKAVFHAEVEGGKKMLISL